MIAPAAEAIAETFELDDLFALTEREAGAFDVDDIVHDLVGPGDMTRQGMPAGDMLQQSECWGSELHGFALHCDPSFSVTGNHLKDKFCRDCREGGVLVPIWRIKAISRNQHASFSNSTSEGLWNPDSTASLPDYRLVNHTQGCTEPRLIVFQTSPPQSAVAWAALPPGWLHATATGNHIRLWPSKGTLVPTRPRSRPRFGVAQPPPAKRQHTTATATVVPGAYLTTEGGAATAVALGPLPTLEVPSSRDRCSPSSTNSSHDLPGRDGGMDSGTDSGASTHSTFLSRFVEAHTKLRSMVEERLRSSDPMSPDQRDTLLEQASTPAASSPATRG